jgi:hypothetical protein
MCLHLKLFIAYTDFNHMESHNVEYMCGIRCSELCHKRIKLTFIVDSLPWHYTSNGGGNRKSIKIKKRSFLTPLINSILNVDPKMDIKKTLHVQYMFNILGLIVNIIEGMLGGYRNSTWVKVSFYATLMKGRCKLITLF